MAAHNPENTKAGIIKEVLGNGLTVLVQESHTNPVVAILTYVKAGYLNEENRLTGISHLIEHMLFKGTSRRGVGEIHRAIKTLGGYINASTSYEYTTLYTVLPSAHFVHGLNILSDALLNSVFDPGELSRETEVVIHEGKRKYDNPSAFATEKLYELAFEKHWLRRWRIGNEEGLRALTRDDFLTYYRQLYCPPNILLVVAGDIDAKEALHHIQTHYGHFPGFQLIKKESPSEPKQSRFKYRQLKGDIQQAYLEWGYHTPGILHKDTYALDILAFILGGGRSSRLYQQVKEKAQLVNTIHASNFSLKKLGLFEIEATLEPENLREAEQAVWAEIEKLQHGYVTDEELIKARNLLEASYIHHQQTALGRANFLAEYEALGDFRLAKQYLENLYQVTEQDIQTVAIKYLALPNCSLLEYLPQNSAVEPLDTEDIQNKDQKHEEKTTIQISPRVEKSVQETACFEFLAPSESSHTAIEKIILDNGITLLIKENHAIPLVAVGAFFKGGRSLEDETNCGITQLTLKTSLKGTKNRDARHIFSAIETLGSSISLTNEPDYFGYSMTILPKHFEPGWDVFTDVILNPIFPEEELAKERDFAIAAIKRKKDNMFSYPLQLFYATIFHGRAYGLPSEGMESSIIKLRTDELLNWHQRCYSPQNMVVAIVGDINKRKILKEVKATFESLVPTSCENKQVAEIHWTNKGATTIEKREKQQTAIVVGFPGVKYAHPDYYALKVLQNVASGLGGRFFEELRDKQGLAYTVSAFETARAVGGAFLSYIATSPANEELAREGLMAEFRKLIDNPVTDEELQQAKNFIVGIYQIGMETNSAQMAQFVHDEILGKGIDEVNQYPQKIKNVTKEQVQQVAQKYIHLDRCFTTILRGGN